MERVFPWTDPGAGAPVRLHQGPGRVKDLTHLLRLGNLGDGRQSAREGLLLHEQLALRAAGRAIAPSSSTYLWSALSLITLLGGIGAILFFFGKFDYLGWGDERRPPISTTALSPRGS